jgi:hypothetical protein
MKRINRKGYVYICPLVERSRELKTEIKAYPHNYKIEGTLEFDWAEGMVGVAAVFTNKKEAIDYVKSQNGNPENIQRMYFPGKAAA